MKKFKITVLISLFLIFLFPVLYFGINLGIGILSLKKIETAFNERDFHNLTKYSFWARDSFGRNKDFIKFGQPVFELFGMKQKTNTAESLFLAAEVSLDGLAYSLSAAEIGNQIFLKILHGENFNLEEKLRQVKTDLSMAYERTSMAQGLLNNFSGEERFFGPQVKKLKKELPMFRSVIWEGQEIIGVLPEILGREGRKTYLVLFQNNMEIRPTGGFIGSFGLLTLDKGVLLDFEIQDVYAADGQLKGHVEPPAKLAQFLGQASWYLRDSNWDPDFPTSAAKAEWFLEKELGRRVDGTIALNLFVAQRLLEAFGEIELPDYQEKINAKNFFERAQFHNEVGFFPGSQAKSDFLGAVSNALFEQIKTADQGELVGVSFSLYQSLLEKDILISLQNEKAMNVISKFNWDGALKEVKCKIENLKCLEDYLMIVEANLGVNKANYFLTRSLNLETRISPEGKIGKTLTVFYENKSPSEVFPAGKYKTYLRFYVPEGSVLGQCTIGNNPCQTEETTEHQRTVFAFLAEVPVGEKRQIRLSWELPIDFTFGQYSFFIQKQSGTRNDPLTLSFVYPKWFMTIPKWEEEVSGNLVYNPPVAKTAGFTYNTTLSQDKKFNLEFKKSN